MSSADRVGKQTNEFDWVRNGSAKAFVRTVANLLLSGFELFVDIERIINRCRLHWIFLAARLIHSGVSELNQFCMSQHFAAVNYPRLPHLRTIYCKLIHVLSFSLKSLIYTTDRARLRYRSVANYNNWWPFGVTGAWCVQFHSPSAQFSESQSSRLQISSLNQLTMIQLDRTHACCSVEVPARLQRREANKQPQNASKSSWWNLCTKKRKFIFWAVDANFFSPQSSSRADLSIINFKERPA